MGPAVVGTLLITGAATVDGGAARHPRRHLPQRVQRRAARSAGLSFLAEVMTGVPSIVMGLFIYSIWVLRYGVSGFAGALALACLMLPVVIRTTEEMLTLVPAELREASYALGGRKARHHPPRRPARTPRAGIVSGALLAVARAAGETAPLLFTILTVNETNTNLFHGPNTTLSVQIFRNASRRSRSPGAGLGRRAHPDRDRVHLHPARPAS